MLVTIIIPTYNYGRYLPDALLSVARQSYRPIQVVIVDDGSHDSSGEIISGFRHKALEENLIYEAIALPCNRGKLAALNVALRHVRGSVCAILDADDYFIETFVERSVQTLTCQRIRNSKVGFVYSDCMLTNEALEPLGVGRSTEFDAELLETASYIPDCGLTISELLKRAAPFDESLRVATKHHKWLRLVRGGAIGFHIPEPMFSYRLHDSNLSGIGRRLLRPEGIDHSDRLLSGLWPVVTRGQKTQF